MSRYRLIPAPEQENILTRHCAHARYVWNLAVEQQSWWRPGRSNAPGYGVQAVQLTEARAEHRWLREGSQMVQQQALRDFAQAMANFFAGTHRKPTCRSCGYACNADVNAARNIAAGHVVTARGRSPLGGRMNREPQLLAS
jgi:transposase